MINIETKEDKLLYIDSVTSFDRLREQQLYEMFRRKLNNSDDISEVWLPEISKRDVCIGITIRELYKLREFEKIQSVVPGHVYNAIMNEFML